MRGPHSFTGEDTVEISCHGGSFVTRAVLERVIEVGARAALPGEFSLRAFRNGKIDLAQAESIQQLIGAKSELALHAAEQHLEGALSKKIALFQEGLTQVAALIEAWVDFPEEGLEFASREEIVERLLATTQSMERLAETFHNGRVLHEGVTLCLAGAPNVGKSSLMNAFLGFNRAIVTNIPGTTRDLLQEPLQMGQLSLQLIDTAGIRETDEVIEQEGISRSRLAMQKADLVLLLLDASRLLEAEDRSLLSAADRDKTIVVWNKIDVAAPSVLADWPNTVAISAKEGLGLDQLEKTIVDWIHRGMAPSKEELIITRVRHFRALVQAVVHCRQAIAHLQSGVSPEFIASDLRRALIELGTIIGTDVTEDILTEIFSQFCVGK
jgi:tRNA modification GTPase